MENKIYVITVETGSYDDFNVKVESVTHDFAAGSAYVEKMNACAQSLVKKIHLCYDAASLWAKNNPHPKPQEVLPNPPRTFRADEVITDAMRQALKDVQAKNQLIIQQNKDKHRLWQEAYAQYQEQWFEDNLTPEELEMKKYHDDNYWNIDEVKWFEKTINY
jgi:hypothetical protein